MAAYPGMPNKYAAPFHADSMSYYNAEYPQAYGAIDGFYAQDAKPGQMGSPPNQRKRMNVLALACALFGPWFLFIGVVTAESFSLHYNSPQLVHAVVGASLAVVVSFGASAISALRNQDQDRRPSWYLFMFFTGLIAWALSVFLGHVNFFTHMQPYYDIQNLNVYHNVDPELKKGQQLMDAGKVVFVPNAHIDLKRAWSFKNLENYCVAPISTVDANGTMMNLPHYDFWAVGINCCGGNGEGFSCSKTINSKAHAGLREMRDDLRPFFRLAVQQAQAAHAISARHPLFFFWVEDPIREVHDYEGEGYKYVLLGLCAHFSLQLLFVVGAALTFAKTYW